MFFTFPLIKAESISVQAAAILAASHTAQRAEKKGGSMFTLEVGMFSFFASLFFVPVVLTFLSLRKQTRRPFTKEVRRNALQPATRATVDERAPIAGSAHS
jgi:hypothetical protein